MSFIRRLANCQSDCSLPGVRDTHHPAPDDLDLAAVLHGLSDPVRLDVVRQLADGQPHSCGSIDPPPPAPSMPRHFRILRESGVIRVRPVGRQKLLTLRSLDLDARFPVSMPR